MTPPGCVPDTRTLGIDEAGRGPILGPLVVAGVTVRPRAAAALTRAGVVDSKAFGAGDEAVARRRALAARIRACAESVVVRVVDVTEIDRRVRRHELNVLEREVAVEIIERSAPAERILADGARLFAGLALRFPNLVARDHGEAAHVAVAAASVVAKARRDELFACIARRYEAEFGPLGGGGYENDATFRFLAAYAERHRRLPPEARRSWSWPRLAPHLPRGFDPWADLAPAGQLELLASVGVPAGRDRRAPAATAVRRP